MKITISLSPETIKKGKLLAAARDTSLSQLVDNLIEGEFKVKEITSAAEGTISPYSKTN